MTRQRGGSDGEPSQPAKRQDTCFAVPTPHLSPRPPTAAQAQAQADWGLRGRVANASSPRCAKGSSLGEIRHRLLLVRVATLFLHAPTLASLPLKSALNATSAPPVSKCPQHTQPLPEVLCDVGTPQLFNNEEDGNLICLVQNCVCQSVTHNALHTGSPTFIIYWQSTRRKASDKCPHSHPITPHLQTRKGSSGR